MRRSREPPAAPQRAVPLIPDREARYRHIRLAARNERDDTQIITTAALRDDAADTEIPIPVANAT
ncbi:MAG TPA: hypothetical protein PKC29_01330 [Thermodesulfobacteriota bacterium]|nr:hypothetical protein [Thermodesulfobacteriota bacterium]